MSSVSTSRFAVIAAAALSLGIVTAPGTAHAEACEYEFPSLLEIRMQKAVFEPDEPLYQIPVSGSPRRTVGPGKAMMAIVGFTEARFGTPYGGMNGNNIDFTINFDDGSAEVFRGQIDPDGVARGKSGSYSWRSTGKMSCVYKPPVVEAPVQANPGAAEKTAFVAMPPDVDYHEVDVHEAPDGESPILGTVPEGKGLQVEASCQPENWCHVRGSAVPTGQGYIWGHLRFE